jgi:hypothetical protein
MHPYLRGGYSLLDRVHLAIISADQMDSISTTKLEQYDYRTAIKRVNILIERLQEASTHATGPADPPSQLAAALRFWRSNWRGVLALVTLYSIPTAAVTALVFAERHKRVCRRA